MRRIDVRRAHAGRLEPGGALLVRADGRETRVRLAWTSCHLGGQRPWLVCPACGRRRLALFVYASVIACRRCLGLRYRSQLQDAPTRLAERARRIERSLGWDDGDRWIPRPRGMWRRTYQRRLAAAHTLWAAAGELEDAAAWSSGLRLMQRIARRGGGA